MNRLALQPRLLAVLFLALSAGSPAFSQVPTAGSPTGINAAFVKLFSGVSAFTAKVEARAFDSTQKETVRMLMDWTVLDGKVRLDIDLEQMTNKDLPAATVASLKQAGMARITSVFRPDKKATYVIYPGVQAYQTIPLAEGELKALERGLKLEKTAVGKETVDGHACVKNKAIIKSGQERVLEAVTWNAADLKEFPVQIEMKEKQSTVRLRFSRIQFVKPAATQFEVPAKYGLMK